MTLSLDHCRAVIGTFNCGSSFTVNNHSISLKGSFICFLLICILTECLYISLLSLLYIFSFLLCHGDIEPNSGPRKLKQNSLSVCQWNLNSLSAHNFPKITAIENVQFSLQARFHMFVRNILKLSNSQNFARNRS